MVIQWNHRSVVLVVCLFLVAILLPSCAVNPVTGRSEFKLTSVSQKEEIDMGSKSYGPVVQSQGGFYRDEKLTAYIQSVGDRLSAVSHRPGLPYKFRVVNSSVPNAFALPGGYIAVNRGLLVALTSEGELAAVVGHEIGHVTARHSVAAYQRALGMNLALLGLSIATGKGAGSTEMRLSSIAAGLIENGYSREQERESDYLGVDYMVKAGYDPEGAIDLQEYFYNEFEKGKGSSWVTGLFRTHPFSSERLANMKSYIGKKYRSALGAPDRSVYEERYTDKMGAIRKIQKAYDVYDEGEKLLRKKHYRDARKKFLEAIDMEPSQAPFYSLTGVSFLLDDKPNSAITYLRKAVDRDPEYALGRFYLGAAFEKAGRCRESVPHLEKSMDLMPTKNGASYLVKCYREMGEYEKARKYEKMLR